MMTEIQKLVAKCIRVDGARHNLDLSVELQKNANGVFEEIRRLISEGRISARKLPNALRCLSAATKHADESRIGELLRIILPLTQHPSIEVRTQASMTIAWRNFDATLAAKHGVHGAPTRAELVAALRGALAKGISPDQVDRVASFLSSHRDDE